MHLLLHFCISIMPENDMFSSISLFVSWSVLYLIELSELKFYWNDFSMCVLVNDP